MNPDFPMFQDSSRAKILIHHGNQIHQKDRNDKKQAYSSSSYHNQIFD